MCISRSLTSASMAWSKVQCLWQVLSLSEPVVQAGVEADAAIYNSIMRQQASAGSGPAVLEGTLADMEAHGVQPDRHSLFLLLREHSRRGDLTSAMSIMRRMAQLGRGPSPPLSCCKSIA